MTAHSQLFDRIVVVKAQQQPLPTSFVAKNLSFFQTVDIGVEISKLRIEFDVTKNLGKEPNKTTLKIFNMAPSTRSIFDRKPTRVTLLAGYDGNPRLLTTGDLIIASTKRVGGVDLVTTITIGDGMRAYSHARMNTRYSPTTTPLRILQDAARSFNVELPANILDDARLKQPNVTSLTMFGPTRDVFTTYLASFGYGWSFQNGGLQVLRDDDTQPGDIIPVDESTGLLESPEVTPPEQPSASGKGKPSEIKFKMNLYPELVPGKVVKIASDFLNATAKLIEVKHSGNNRNGTYVSECTAKAV